MGKGRKKAPSPFASSALPSFIEREILKNIFKKPPSCTPSRLGTRPKTLSANKHLLAPHAISYHVPSLLIFLAERTDDFLIDHPALLPPQKSDQPSCWHIFLSKHRIKRQSIPFPQFASPPFDMQIKKAARRVGSKTLPW